MLPSLMSRLATTVALVGWLCHQGVSAQNATNGYTVYSSFVFARTGERTPQLTYDNVNGSIVKLTPYGATQMYNLGSFFRNRYIGKSSAAGHMILGLNADIIDDLQITVISPDMDFTTKSALAFMGSFYPPYNLNNSTSNQYDPTGVMVNNTYISFPMNGYQLPMIQTYDSYSPGSIWVNGGANCINSDLSRASYYNTAAYRNLYQQTLPLYKVIAPLFYGTAYDATSWSYAIAANVYELLDYLNRHNTTVNRAFAKGGQYEGLLPVFSEIANTKLWSMYGNKSVSGSTPGDGILTISGQALATFILEQLESNVYNRGLYNKFNIAVGDFQPLLSLISLLGLDNFAPNFRSLPPFGSAIVFEVFSYTSNASSTPNPSDLYVQVLFRNASDVTSSDPNAPAPEVQAYSMFGRGPSGTVMSWTDFQREMSRVSVSSIASWCTTCQAGTLFCIPFLRNSAAAAARKRMSPAVGGVIGAIVTLVIAGLIFAAAVFLFGVRVHRRQRTSQLGGFKGSAKLASDTDLRLPDNAVAPAGAVVTGKGHERVGSWELKGPEEKELGASGHQRFASLGSTVVGRPSYEEDPNDISEELHSTPTTAREGV